jgi:hypothetical protein
MVASKWITPGGVKFLRIENVFTRPGPRTALSVVHAKMT